MAWLMAAQIYLLAITLVDDWPDHRCQKFDNETTLSYQQWPTVPPQKVAKGPVPPYLPTFIVIDLVTIDFFDGHYYSFPSTFYPHFS